eukprot:TRINITY_DN11341_c0_g1_i3.p1 TRINITY_DN11341_c0_g1~~TRINITY_DN11341_c0_g1_i3.p1  ORF type:complete len:364 (+),score=112.85 TRINITY_DN11341_c0_g1_i3:122-1213(+)
MSSIHASSLYASKQPQGHVNHVEKVAIVGATGQLGKHLVDALLKTGKHTITAITREGSSSSSSSAVPAGVHVAKVDYNDPSSLVNALKGQHALIITMAVTAPHDTHDKLIEAAAAAGVPFVLPNEWGYDMGPEGMGKDTMLGKPLQARRDLIEKLGKSSWIGIANGFWYEFSLGGTPDRFGFDFANRRLTWFDDGNTKISVTTWPQCGRAVASLLSLPILPQDEHDHSTTLSSFKNKHALVSSFFGDGGVSQRDMFESVLRVTGTQESDWTIEGKEDPHERWQKAVDLLMKGDFKAFVRVLYARIFFKEDPGNHESRSHNEVLGLPKEDIDKATKEAIEFSKTFQNYSFILSSGPLHHHCLTV